MTSGEKLPFKSFLNMYFLLQLEFILVKVVLLLLHSSKIIPFCFNPLQKSLLCNQKSFSSISKKLSISL